MAAGVGVRGDSVSVGLPLKGDALTTAISTAMADLYREFYGHDRTTATTFINGNIVLCVLKQHSHHQRVAAGEVR